MPANMTNKDMIFSETFWFLCLTFAFGYVSVDFVACQTRISSPSFFTDISHNSSFHNTQEDSKYTCFNGEMFLYIQNGFSFIYLHSVQLFLVLILKCLFVDLKYLECANLLWNSTQKTTTFCSPNQGDKSGEAPVVSKNQTTPPAGGFNTDSTQTSQKHYTAAELHAFATVALQLLRIIVSIVCGCLIVYSLHYLFVKATPLPENTSEIKQSENLKDKKEVDIYGVVRMVHTIVAAFTAMGAVALVCGDKTGIASKKLTIARFQEFLDWFHSSPPFMQQLRSLSLLSCAEFLLRAALYAPFVLIVYWNVASCVTLVQQYTQQRSQQAQLCVDRSIFYPTGILALELLFLFVVQLFFAIPFVQLIVVRVELNAARSRVAAQR